MGVKICLDAGHYGKYNQSPVNEVYYESDMNWKLHLYLKAELEAYGIEVITTRSNKNNDLTVYNRGLASKGCDLFISLHSNACGVETVDYPVAIVQLDGKGDKLGNVLAKCVAKQMKTKQDGRIFKKQGTTGEYYGVLRGAAAVGTMGIIIEHSFHTNKAAASWLLNDNNLKAMAVEEAKIIAEYYGLKKSTTAANKTTIYRVQVGAYKDKKNAETMLKKLEAAGFEGYIKQEEL